MNTTLRQRLQANPMLGLLCLALLLLPVTNSAGQIPLYMASMMWLVQAFRRREKVDRIPLMFLLIYACIILATLFYGVRPAYTVSKLNRLLLFPLVFAVPCALKRGPGPRENLSALLLAAVIGMSLMAVYDLVRMPLEIREQVAALHHESETEPSAEALRKTVSRALFHAGNMASPQLYMIAFFFLLGLKSETGSPKTKWFLLLCILSIAGLLLHNKRGVWIATMLIFPVWTLWSRQWKNIPVMMLVALFALALPSVRERLTDLRDVVNVEHGSRMVLWTEVAPRLYQLHPFGMGYNGSRFEDFREVLPRGTHLEIGLTHLHSNPLQILLELGWHGLIIWILWMIYYLRKAIRPLPRELRLLRGSVACAFLALLVNGLVEYNFGTSSIFMMYMVLFGILESFSPNTRHECIPRPEPEP